MVFSVGRVARGLGNAINRGARSVGRGIDKAAHFVGEAGSSVAGAARKGLDAVDSALNSNVGRAITDGAASLAENSGVPLGGVIGRGIRGSGGVVKGARKLVDGLANVSSGIASGGRALGKRVRDTGGIVGTAVNQGGQRAEQFLNQSRSTFNSASQDVRRSLGLKAGGGKNTPSLGGMGMNLGRAAKRLSTGLSRF